MKIGHGFKSSCTHFFPAKFRMFLSWMSFSFLLNLDNAANPFDCYKYQMRQCLQNTYCKCYLYFIVLMLLSFLILNELNYYMQKSGS